MFSQANKSGILEWLTGSCAMPVVFQKLEKTSEVFLYVLGFPVVSTPRSPSLHVFSLRNRTQMP